jgi:hypothetical protein
MLDMALDPRVNAAYSHPKRSGYDALEPIEILRPK